VVPRENGMMTDPMLQRLTASLRRCPKLNGREEFIRSAVLALLMRREGSWHMVLQRRHPSIRQGDEICFPGGRIDAGEEGDPVATALRETREEMGIGADRIRVLGLLDYVIAPTGNLVMPVVGSFDGCSLDDFTPNPREVTRIFTVPLDWFREHEPEVYHVQLRAYPEVTGSDGKRKVLFPTRTLGLPERYHRPWNGGRMRVFVYRYDGEVIWGMTARIIMDLMRRVDGTGSDE